MADTPPDNTRSGDQPDPQTVSGQTVSGMSNDSTTVTAPVVLPQTQKPPAKMGPDGKPSTEQPEDEGQTSSRFVESPALKALREQMNFKTVDPHLEEMLRSAKIQQTKDKKGFVIDIDQNHQIFAGTINNKNVIGVPNGGKVDEVSAKTMVAMAKARGWDTVYCTLLSDQSEKEALWLESKRQGLKMGNFTPDRDSDVAKQWAEEQRNGGPNAKLTNAPPETNPHTDTLNLLKAAADGTTNDPALKASLTKVFDTLRTGNTNIDDKTFKAVSEALSEKPGREGFNAIATALNAADPTLKIAPLDPTPVDPTATRVSPRLTQARATAP